LLYHLRLVLCLTCLLVAGCPTHAHYKYDCRGTLLNADGTPAIGVAIHIETVAPTEQLPSKDTHWWETYRSSSATEKTQDWVWWDDYSFMDLTDKSGQFTTNCDLDIDKGLWGGSDNDLTFEGVEIVSIRRPSPELSKIWLWIRSPDGWIAIPVQLGHASQTHVMPGGREIDLPPVTLPSTTRPTSDRIGMSPRPLSRDKEPQAK
jgi:hypothetical protein